MQLAHIAIWDDELERSRDFYIKFFNGKSNEKYVNPKKGFASYFVTFEGGASLEIMQRTDITKETADVFIGLAHFAFSTGSKEKVDAMIESIPFGRLQDHRRCRVLLVTVIMKELFWIRMVTLLR